MMDGGHVPELDGLRGLAILIVIPHNTDRFDVAKELLDEARDAVSFGRGRCARGNALLDHGAPRLTPRSMMAILRDHGDDPQWSPANTEGRTICMHAAQGPRRSQSVGSMVSELRPGRLVQRISAGSTAS